VIAQFTVVPIGKGESLSEYVAECERIVKKSGLKSELTPMCTVLEGEYDEVMEVVAKCHKRVRAMSNRVMTSIDIDDRGGAKDAMEKKVESVERKLRAKK